MHARVTQARILPGKLREFTDAVETMMPTARKQAGIRAVMILLTQEKDPVEVTIISVWDSFDDLKASEKNMYFYQALSRVLTFCEGFPAVREHEVLISEFAAD